MKKYQVSFIFSSIFFLFFIPRVFTQPNCLISPTSNCNPVGSGSVYIMSTPLNADFTFDSFGKFITGITQNGASLLKLVVTQAAAPCRWQLHIYADNGGGATPVNEWELMTPYGLAGPLVPPINLLQIRVRNECNTSLTGNSFVTLANTGSSVPIVQSPGVSNAAGTCTGSNVNTPGSYITDYGEFHFTIDYRIVPTLNLRPGVYQIVIRYCLTEDI